MRPTIVIGDIHGRADLLKDLLARIRGRFGTDVDLYHAGDLIDRGPNSKEVVQIAIDNGINGILGNHEIWFHKWATTGEFDSFALHPTIRAAPTLASYGVSISGVGGEDTDDIARQLEEKVPQAHRDYILSLPVWRKLKVGDQVYRLIHTGLKRHTAEDYHNVIDPSWPRHRVVTVEDVEDTMMNLVAEKSPASILWLGNSWKNPELYHFKDGSIQVLGHSPTPRAEPLITAHWIAIDCGCGVRRSMLAGIVLGTHEVISTNAVKSKGVQSGGFTDFTL